METELVQRAISMVTLCSRGNTDLVIFSIVSLLLPISSNLPTEVWIKYLEEIERKVYVICIQSNWMPKSFVPNSLSQTSGFRPSCKTNYNRLSLRH